MSESSSLYPEFSRRLAELAAGTGAFTVALSGGVDSVVLLHLAARYREENPQVNLAAVHINHGLSPHAGQWQAFCEQLCERFAVPFQAVQVKVEQKARTSLESAARDARYRALAKVVEPGCTVLLGQHRSDQVETFFLRLKRGAGLKGLSAMAPATVSEGGLRLLRPLLTVSREEIEAYAEAHDLKYVEDESNSDTRFDRNFLRHQVLPELNGRFRGFDACVARTVDLLSEQQQLIDELSEADLAGALGADGGLLLTMLAKLSPARRANVLRCWLEKNAVAMPSRRRLDELLRQLIEAKNDAQIDIPLGAVSLKRHGGAAYLVKPEPVPQARVIDGNKRIEIAPGRILSCKEGKGIRAPLADEVVSVRFNLPGTRFRPLNKPGSNSLKHWFKDAKVAPWLRPGVALIFYNDTLVQVVGYFVSHDHRSEQGICWQEE